MKLTKQVAGKSALLLVLFFCLSQATSSSNPKQHNFTKLSNKIDHFSELITFDPSTIQ